MTLILRLRNMTLRNRLILVACILVYLIFSLAEAIRLYNTFTESQQAMDTRANLLADAYAASVASPIWNFEYAAVETALQHLDESNDFFGISIRDPGGEFIYQARSKKPAERTHTVKRDIQWSVPTKTKIIGSLSLTLSADQIYAEALASALYSLMMLVILLALCSGAIYLSFRALTKPVEQLTAASNAIARGNYVESIPYTSRQDEIGTLARAISILNENTRELHHLQDSLEQIIISKTGELIRAKNAAEAGSRAKTEFLSTVSHELRTPLTSIRGSLGLLQSEKLGELSASARELTEIAERNSIRLLALVNDILDIQKIEFENIEFELAPIDLRSTVENAVLDLHGYAEDYKVRLEVKDLVSAIVLADERRIEQVLANLLSNAIKFSPPESAVVISMSDDGHHISVYVSDSGPGIPPAFREQVFERFMQGDSSDTRNVGGTGLGLNIARAIIQRHDGHIDFNTATGQGTTFFFRLRKQDPGSN